MPNNEESGEEYEDGSEPDDDSDSEKFREFWFARRIALITGLIGLTGALVGGLIGFAGTQLKTLHDIDQQAVNMKTTVYSGYLSAWNDLYLHQANIITTLDNIQRGLPTVQPVQTAWDAFVPAAFRASTADWNMALIAPHLDGGRSALLDVSSRIMNSVQSGVSDAKDGRAIQATLTQELKYNMLVERTNLAQLATVARIDLAPRRRGLSDIFSFN
ncbi:hypothetical protein H7H51_26135 [Mycolicibacterium farcinogenes]|nr:hypothetical protein [Mycolicibacterium farcinogenes]